MLPGFSVEGSSEKAWMGHRHNDDRRKVTVAEEEPRGSCTSDGEDVGRVQGDRLLALWCA